VPVHDGLTPRGRESSFGQLRGDAGLLAARGTWRASFELGALEGVPAAVRAEGTWAQWMGLLGLLHALA
jgi:hypothetical protein